MNNRRTHTDSHVLDLGRREAKRQGTDVATLPLTEIEDLGFVVQRRRRVVAVVGAAVATTVLAIGFNFVSDQYDSKYDGCPTDQTADPRTEDTPPQLDAFAAAEAGCSSL